MRPDCVIVGHNDTPFSAFARDYYQSRSASGAYNEVVTNSVLLDGERASYMDLLNRSVRAATGRPSNLSPFDMPHLGVCHLKSFLQRRGLGVEMINFFNGEKDRFAELLALAPRAVAITTTYYIRPDPIREIVAFVRDRAPGTRIIVGGPHVFSICRDYDPDTQDFLFDQIGADVYIYDSQGEATLTAVVRALRDHGPDAPLDQIPNLVHRDGPGFRRNQRVVEKNGIDEDRVDWRLFEPSLFAPIAYLRTAISCPFRCEFCNYPEFAGDHLVMDVASLERDMRHLHEHGVKYLIFTDDTFNVPLPRFKKICRMMIENKFDFRWISFFRCSNADDEAFDLMAASGCIGALLGIESADQTVLNNMRKFAKVDRYHYGVRALRERGIVTCAAFIIGFPGETRDSFERTRDFIAEAAPTYYIAQQYYHQQFTPIARRNREFDIRGSGYSWSHATMDWQEAGALVRELLRTPTASTVLPLRGYSLWTLPYLMSRGYSLQLTKRFAELAQRMLVDSLDDAPQASEAHLAALASLFAGGAEPGATAV